MGNWLQRQYDKHVATPMQEANLTDFNRGVEKLQNAVASPLPVVPAKVQQYLPPVMAVQNLTKVATTTGRVFGTTVEAVRPALDLTKNRSASERAAAAGVAGSAALFGSVAVETYRGIKQGVEATPAPIRKVVAPVLAFGAGVVAVPIAARYAPGLVDNLPVGTALSSTVPPLPSFDGTRTPPTNAGAGGSELREEPDRGQPPLGTAPPGTASSEGQPGSVPPPARSTSRAVERKQRSTPRRSPVRAKRTPKPEGKPVRDGSSKLDASRSRRRTPRRRRSRSDRSSVVSTATLKLLKSLEKQGLEVTLSPK